MLLSWLAYLISLNTLLVNYIQYLVFCYLLTNKSLHNANYIICSVNASYDDLLKFQT